MRPGGGKGRVRASFPVRGRSLFLLLLLVFRSFARSLARMPLSLSSLPPRRLFGSFVSVSPFLPARGRERVRRENARLILLVRRCPPPPPTERASEPPSGIDFPYVEEEEEEDIVVVEEEAHPKWRRRRR